jgi:biopolymer transport protein ExbD
MKLKRRATKRGRVEIIPMIDTILILLIFYMTFSTFKQQEKRIDAKLPLVSAKVAPTQLPLDLVLHVKNKDHIVVNKANTYDIVSLRDTLLQLATVGQNTTIIIGADPETSYQDVISVLDACAQAHLTKVAFRPLTDKVASVQ